MVVRRSRTSSAAAPGVHLALILLLVALLPIVICYLRQDHTRARCTLFGHVSGNLLSTVPALRSAVKWHSFSRGGAGAWEELPECQPAPLHGGCFGAGYGSYLRFYSHSGKKEGCQKKFHLPFFDWQLAITPNSCEHHPVQPTEQQTASRSKHDHAQERSQESSPPEIAC